MSDVEGLGLVDRWLGIDVHLRRSRPTHFRTFPIHTVSQADGDRHELGGKPPQRSDRGGNHKDMIGPAVDGYRYRLATTS